MIAYLKGKAVYHGANYLVVETGGIGYKVFVGPDTAGKKEVQLFIYHYIREDTDTLYGFETKDELEIFELLLSVSGVGPKAALAIISGLGANKIISAIGRGDATLFKTISGIGGKVAAKIIVELKNKVEGGTLTTSLLPEEDETVEALTSLGYKMHEIIPYLKDIPESATTTQEKIKFVLKNVGKRRK
jgi:Holliday junction DNA helicase RuvA